MDMYIYLPAAKAWQQMWCERPAGISCAYFIVTVILPGLQHLCLALKPFQLCGQPSE